LLGPEGEVDLGKYACPEVALEQDVEEQGRKGEDDAEAALVLQDGDNLILVLEFLDP
jgi:hypothetical protein